MKSTAFVLSTVVGMILVGMLATHVPAAEVITKTEKITWYDVEIEAVKTAENFLVLFNTAKTMGRPYKNTGLRLRPSRNLSRPRTGAATTWRRAVFCAARPPPFCAISTVQGKRKAPNLNRAKRAS